MFATHLGSLPGTDFRAAVRLVRDRLGRADLPELPARGVGAQMIGRSASVLDGLAVDLQPAGWRLTDHPGRDQRRARALFRRDLDDLEEECSTFAGGAKLSVAGPWTLAAGIELPRGELVLADVGATRDLAGSLASGLTNLVDELRRRFPAAAWTVQLDEPSLPAVHAGALRTASGYGRHRAVDEATVGQGLAVVASAVVAAGAEVAVHSCAPGMQLEWLERAGIGTVALDVGLLADRDLEALGSWLESGRQVWWGVQPTQLPDHVLSRDELLATHRRIVGQLGLDPVVVDERSAVSPACGLAGWSAGAVSRVFDSLVWLAEAAPDLTT
jgi:methionine synthase II (cobalamin-independent)